MQIIPTPLEGLFEIRHNPIEDIRGSFTRLFCEQELFSIRPNWHFRQINWSQTKGRGAVRGMHCQKPPAAEAKLIQCLHGSVFDVAVDLRADSPTFLQWHAVELSEHSAHALFIPEGFAHGFQTLSEDAHLLYMHTAFWSPNCEMGFRHDDPRLAISWPLTITQCSERDYGHPWLNADFEGLRL